MEDLATSFASLLGSCEFEEGRVRVGISTCTAFYAARGLINFTARILCEHNRRPIFQNLTPQTACRISSISGTLCACVCPRFPQPVRTALRCMLDTFRRSRRRLERSLCWGDSIDCRQE